MLLINEEDADFILTFVRGDFERLQEEHVKNVTSGHELLESGKVPPHMVVELTRHLENLERTWPEVKAGYMRMIEILTCGSEAK